jgi:hypothetical protein
MLISLSLSRYAMEYKKNRKLNNKKAVDANHALTPDMPGSIYLYVPAYCYLCVHILLFMCGLAVTLSAFCVSALRLQHKICVPAYTLSLAPSLSSQVCCMCKTVCVRISPTTHVQQQAGGRGHAYCTCTLHVCPHVSSKLRARCGC